MNDHPKSLNLTSLISKIRSELEEAEAYRLAGDQSPLFRLSELELELNFIVTESESEKKGVNVQIVEGTGEKISKNEQIQKIRLKFSLDEDSANPSDTNFGTRFSRDVKPLD